MKISEKIFEIMAQKGMSQLELSQKTGIPQSVISDWKTGLWQLQQRLMFLQKSF